MFYPLSIILTFALLFSGPNEMRREIATNWNGMAASMVRQTPALKQLEFAYHHNPPWAVYDAEGFKARKENLKIAIREAELQVKCLKALERAE